MQNPRYSGLLRWFKLYFVLGDVWRINMCSTSDYAGTISDENSLFLLLSLDLPNERFYYITICKVSASMVGNCFIKLPPHGMWCGTVRWSVNRFRIVIYLACEHRNRRIAGKNKNRVVRNSFDEFSIKKSGKGKEWQPLSTRCAIISLILALSKSRKF